MVPSALQDVEMGAPQGSRPPSFSPPSKKQGTGRFGGQGSQPTLGSPFSQSSPISTVSPFSQQRLLLGGGPQALSPWGCTSLIGVSREGPWLSPSLLVCLVLVVTAL